MPALRMKWSCAGRIDRTECIWTAKQFTAATDVTALAITKLDGTAKRGSSDRNIDQFKIPVKYIGIGEKLEDLQVFNRAEFVDSLFS